MAFSNAIQKKGPVHINVPFDEPLYETTDQIFIKEKVTKYEIIENDDFKEGLDEFVSIWDNSYKKLVLVGSNIPNKKLQKQLVKLAEDESVLIFTETTSNLHHNKFINSIDKFIFPFRENEYEQLQPDILLTLGGMVVSKKVKQFLRKYKPQHHWHIDHKNDLNTFHCLSKHFRTSPNKFFDKFLKVTKCKFNGYQENGLSIKKIRNKKHSQFLNTATFSDFTTFNVLLKSIPDNCLLQLGNSSVIRYSQLFDMNNNLDIYCNRGTSGIDGSTSTAIGAAYISTSQTVCISGDISFFYDSNALWNNYIKNDFRIIVINNGGGGIFKFIPGPSNTNALDYFETPHHLKAEQLCKMFGFAYYSANNMDELKDELRYFYQLGKEPKLLEIFTPPEVNEIELNRYFDCL